MSQVIYNLSDISTATYPIFVLDPTKVVFATFSTDDHKTSQLHFVAPGSIEIPFKSHSVGLEWIGSNLKNLNIYDVNEVSCKTIYYPIVAFDPTKIAFTKIDQNYQSGFYSPNHHPCEYPNSLTVLTHFYFEGGGVLGGAFAINFHNKSVALEWIQDNLGESALAGVHNDTEQL